MSKLGVFPWELAAQHGEKPPRFPEPAVQASWEAFWEKKNIEPHFSKHPMQTFLPV